MPFENLSITTADGLADAVAAYPDRPGRVPGVVMYPDAFGIRPVIKQMASTLADHGYYVLVPNTFYRHGPAPLFELPEYIEEDVRITAKVHFGHAESNLTTQLSTN